MQALALAALWAGWGAAGQVPEAPPALARPLPPPDRQERDRRKALDLYIKGLRAQHDGNLIEAMNLLEDVRRLDPDAVPPRQALMPLYLGLLRIPEALESGERILASRPDDAASALFLAEALRRSNREGEAAAVLEKTLPNMADNLPGRIRMLIVIATLREEQKDSERAEKTLRELAVLLDRPEASEIGVYGVEDIERKSAEVHERIGRYAVERGDTEAGLASYLEAYRRDPVRTARLGLRLAEIQARKGHRDEAMPRLEEYLATKPQMLDGYELLVRLRRQAGADARLLEELRIHAQNDPGNADLRMLWSRELVRSGRKEEALEQAMRVLREQAHPGAAREVVLGLLERGQPGAMRIAKLMDEWVVPEDGGPAGGPPPFPGSQGGPDACRVLVQALLEDPARLKRVLDAIAGQAGEGTAANQGALARFKPQTLVLLAEAATRFRSHAQARSFVMEALRRPDPRQAVRLDELRFFIVELCLREHRRDEALAVCRRIRDELPEAARPRQSATCASILLSMGRYPEALAELKQAVDASDPKVALWAGRLKALALAHLGKASEADAHLLALEREHTLPGEKRDISLARIRVLKQTGRDKEALAELESLVERNAADPDLANELAYELAEKGADLPRAEKLIREALELEAAQRRQGVMPRFEQAAWTSAHDSAMKVDSLGWILFKRGRLDEACRELERATRLPEGDDPVLWDHLGDALSARGEPAAARACWERAAALWRAGQDRPGENRLELIERKLKGGAKAARPN
jgi:tetratricopeptide (TPR) repeat protein